MKTVLVAFLLSRALLVAAAGLSPGLPRWTGPAAHPLIWRDLPDGRSYIYHPSPLLDPWLRNDGVYYLQIAVLGYEPPPPGAQVKEGFLPGYPLAVRGLALLLEPLLAGDSEEAQGRLLLSNLVAALLLSNLALLISLLLLVTLGETWLGPVAARRAAVLVAVNPFSFLYSCVLTESLFLALALATFVGVRQGRPLAAGLLGGCAAATRIFGTVLWLPLSWMSLRSSGEGRLRFERLLLLLLVPAGLCLALVLPGRATGSPWTYFEVQRHFGHEEFPTLAGLGALFHLDEYTPWEAPRKLLQLVTLWGVVALLAVQLRLTRQGRLPGALLLYVIPLLLLPLLAGSIISLPRYSLVLFPLALAAGTLVPGGLVGGLLAGLSMAAQVGLFLTWEANLPLVI